MKKLILSFLLLNSLLTYAQDNITGTENQGNDSLPAILPMSSDPAGNAQLPKIIPPSPEVTSLFKFVDYPVSHSTGVPEISIPLYTVRCGNLSLPVSIDYHAGGRTYQEMTGPVGIGWTLNAGGTISRTIFGYPDEDYPVPNNLKQASSMNVKNDYLYLAELYYKAGSDPLGAFKDSEYDLFSYVLPGMSGSFVLDGGVPKSLTLNGIKISGSVNSFTITGEDGTRYTFQDYGNSTVLASYVSYNTTAKTAWFLNKIKSADGKHTISLTYEGVKLAPNSTTTQFPMVGETMIVNDLPAGSYYPSVSPVNYQNTNMELSFTSQRLKEINFGTGKVVFENEATGGKLKKIHIQDASGTVVKTYSLTHALLDHTITDNYKLSSIATTSGNSQTDTYHFDYYPTSASFAANQHDYWGYLNNNTATMTYLIPEMEIYFNQSTRTVGHAGVTREANEAKMKSGILRQITYPTGSSTEFVYEINKFLYANQIRNCGGLRIKQIRTMDDTGQIQLRTFEYNGTNGYGSLVSMQNMVSSGFESLYLNLSGSMTHPGSANYNGSFRQRVFSSEFPQDYSYYANQPIFYSTVTEYKGDAADNTGKIVYQYANPYSDSYTYNIPAPTYPGTYPSYYPASMPKTFDYDSYSRYYRYISQFGSLWKDRSLTSQTEYAKVNNAYNEVRSTTYTYTDVTAAPLKGLKIFKYIQIKNDDYRHQTEEFAARDYGLPVFLFADYSITRGRRLLSSATEKEIREGGSVSITRNYTYDSSYLLKSITTTNSSGVSQVEETFYPTDDEYKNQAVYAKMISLNMLNIPLKQKVTRGGTSSSNLTTYTDLGGNYIKPSALSTRKDNNAAEVRIQYNKYDNYGNPVSVVKDNTLNIVYLWGYNGMYPVAEIRNATYAEVQTALGAAPESVSSSATYDSRIDNLRAKLPKAGVTVYKYKKLVGLSSVTDPTGLTTFYTYDSFNRLQKISIQEPGGSEKTVETYEYHYKNN